MADRFDTFTGRARKVLQRALEEARRLGHPSMTSRRGTSAVRFDRFTERARLVLQLAQQEAHRLNHNYIGTEHLLLGLVREGDGVAAKVLANLGVEPNGVRSAIESVIGRGDRTVTGHVALTPRAKRVLVLAVDEARRLNHHYIGTEHLLLGLVREGEGIAAGVLESREVALETVRDQVIQILNQSQSSSRQEPRSAGDTPPMQDLVGVVPVAQTQTHDGIAVTVMSVELYADGFIVVGRVECEDRRPQMGERASWFLSIGFSASDERGGRYSSRPMLTIDGDDHRRWRFTQSFESSIGTAARELCLEATVTDPRPSDSASEPGHASVQHGPWVFTVALPVPPGE